MLCRLSATVKLVVLWHVMHSLSLRATKSIVSQLRRSDALQARPTCIESIWTCEVQSTITLWQTGSLRWCQHGKWTYKMYEAARVAVVHWRGCKEWEPAHTRAICGKAVDARGLHGLACHNSAARQQRHSQLNDIIWTYGNKASPDVSSQRASQSDVRWQQTTGWNHSLAMIHRETNGLGRNSARHLCGLTHR